MSNMPATMIMRLTSDFARGRAGRPLRQPIAEGVCVGEEILHKRLCALLPCPLAMQPGQGIPKVPLWPLLRLGQGLLLEWTLGWLACCCCRICG